MNIFKPRLRLVKGTRFVSFLFIGCSILIAAGILFAANMYYNIDTGEIVMEEIQRTTGLIRALGGVIVGGTSTSTLPAGVALEIATSSSVLLSGENQLLRFSGGHASYYTGFQATTSLTTSTVYVWPGTYPGVEGRYLTVDPNTGEMSWDFPAGTGTITAVGDVSGGRSFTSDLGTSYGTTLWFHPNASYLGALTVDPSLSANATYTLPAISGTNYLTLTATSTLANAGVLFADASGLITQDSNFTYSGNQLQVGTNGIKLLGGASASTVFRATTSAHDITYIWPSSVTGGYFLRTDSSGNLTWYEVSLGGLGGVGGDATAGQVAFWTGNTSIGGDPGFTFSTTTDILTVNGGITATGTIGTITAGTSLIAPLITYAGNLTLQTTAGGDIVLAPASGIVKLSGAGTHIETASGYKIGATGTEVLREMIPIMGFDLPVRTATSGMVQISRTIDNYPVSSCTDGTSRLHKLVIRYGSTGTTTWQVATSSTGYTSFDLPPTNSTTTGTVHTATTSIPTPAGACTGWIQNSATDDWWVRVNPGGNDTMIYQIFLAAYDQIQ